MPDYYKGMCKNCQEDCDGEFCSEACASEWNDGYADFLYEQHRNRLLDDTHLFMPQGSNDD